MSTSTAHRVAGVAEPKLMSGAQILLECLVRENVDCIFGYPGGVTLPLYDAFYDHPMRHVLVRHEQNAAFAAEGYARSTGRVGVCCATSGPGATNLVTGLVDSMMDSIPVVALTGQVSTKLIGSDAFQEADTFGITRSCTKHNFLVKTVAELPQAIHEAFYIASSGRPGPVLVDIPKDVFQAQAHYTPVSSIHLPGYKVFTEGHTGQLSAFAPHAKVIHVDIDPAEIGKNRVADLPIVGDVKRVLQRLNKALHEIAPANQERNASARHIWRRQIADWKEQHPLLPEISTTEIKPQHVMREIDRISGGRAIVASDVGQHQMWGAQFIRFNEPRLWINSGGLGSMGFGLPAAIGAQFACPDKLVFALVGDGGHHLSVSELAKTPHF